MRLLGGCTRKVKVCVFEMLLGVFFYVVKVICNDRKSKGKMYVFKDETYLV